MNVGGSYPPFIPAQLDMFPKDRGGKYSVGAEPKSQTF